MICKCQNPQPNIFIAEGNFCDKCKNRIIYKEMTENKIPYQIRIEPEQLEALKQTAKNNGTSVNHEIRQAVRKHLKNA